MARGAGSFNHITPGRTNSLFNSISKRWLMCITRSEANSPMVIHSAKRTSNRSTFSKACLVGDSAFLVFLNRRKWHRSEPFAEHGKGTCVFWIDIAQQGKCRWRAVDQWKRRPHVAPKGAQFNGKTVILISIEHIGRLQNHISSESRTREPWNYSKLNKQTGNQAFCFRHL